MDNPAVDPDVMDISGVLPYRRRVRRGLLMRLAGNVQHVSITTSSFRNM